MHFTVLVVGEDPEAQLAPFSENLDCVDNRPREKPGKWDWYQLGGRWMGTFRLKPGATGKRGVPGSGNNTAENDLVDSARKGDIDWEATRAKERARLERIWDKAASEIAGGLAAFLYGVSKDDTRESYAESGSIFITCAVLYDGKWTEYGGRKRPNSTTDFTAFVVSLPDDTLLSVYDCHT